MGKRRIVKKTGGGIDSGKKARALSRVSKRRFENGILHIQATFNNTRALLTDPEGRVAATSSSGALGFKGAKKGTPFAAAKVGELIGEQAGILGVKTVSVVVKGVGAGRESSLRAFAGKGVEISAIRDATPVPFNGPRPKKPRRV